MKITVELKFKRIKSDGKRNVLNHLNACFNGYIKSGLIFKNAKIINKKSKKHVKN